MRDLLKVTEGDIFVMVSDRDPDYASDILDMCKPESTTYKVQDARHDAGKLLAESEKGTGERKGAQKPKQAQTVFLTRLELMHGYEAENVVLVIDGEEKANTDRVGMPIFCSTKFVQTVFASFAVRVEKLCDEDEVEAGRGPGGRRENQVGLIIRIITCF